MGFIVFLIILILLFSDDETAIKIGAFIFFGIPIIIGGIALGVEWIMSNFKPYIICFVIMLVVGIIYAKKQKEEQDKERIRKMVEEERIKKAELLKAEKIKKEQLLLDEKISTAFANISYTLPDIEDWYEVNIF